MAYEVSDHGMMQHRLVMEDRSNMTVTGVEDVERFDESAIVMTTSQGTLIVAGQNLHIGKLSLDGGELHVEGQIESLAYEDLAPAGGFWQRMFG